MDVFKHEYISSQFYNTDNKLTDKQTILLNKLLLENNYIISQFGFEDVMYVDNSTLHQIIEFINNNKPISISAISILNKSNITIENINNILNTEYTNYNELTHGNFNRICFNFPNINLDYVINRFNIVSNDTVLEYNTEWEYGYQISDKCVNDKLYYLKFYNLIMIDFDNKDYEKINTLMKNFIELIDNTAVLYVYETTNGYHIYLVSKLIDHLHPSLPMFLKFFQCDPYYIIFTIKNGFKIRLSLKKNTTFVEKFVECVGNKDNIDQKCLKFIDLIEVKMQHVSQSLCNTIIK